MMKSLAVAAVFALTHTAFADGPRPVVAATDQALLLKSTDPKLAANKTLVYDFTRIILRGLQLDQLSKFMRTDYIQHNPNVDTGMDGFIKAFSRQGGPRPVPTTVPDLVSIQAEGDIVTMSFVNQMPDPTHAGSTYTTTWFDMFRVQDGKIAEHWDCDVKSQ